MEHAPQPAAAAPSANGTRPKTMRVARPETLRLRMRLDDVMARLHEKLGAINGEEAKAIADRIDHKATRMACAAFKPEDLELEEEPDGPAT